MDYEKKYNDALNLAKSYYGNGCNEFLDTIFPELRESEDERHRKWILEYLYDGLQKSDEQFKDQFKSAIAWLEKQKEQKPAEWSEEDKDYYDTIVRKLEVIGDDSGLSNNQIKFLREHCPSHCLEWSEEDDKMLTGIIERGSSQVPPYEPALREEQMEWLMNRLKSLRPSWKPSEEQMEALEECGECKRCVKELYEQLKKLGVKEEPEYYQHFDPDC